MKPLRIKNLVLGQGIPKICIPMTGKNEEELLKELAYIREFTPDLVEWRVDCLKNQESMWEMLKTISDNLGEIPLLFTFRTAGEGGCREIMYEDYVNLLKKAADSRYADLIDAELFFCPEGGRGACFCIKGKGSNGSCVQSSLSQDAPHRRNGAASDTDAQMGRRCPETCSYAPKQGGRVAAYDGCFAV